jgi:hypothetical protein
MTDIHSNIEMSSKEMLAYRNKVEQDNPGYTVTYLDINVRGDDVELTATLSAVKSQRIRRITGYLVGTLDRFNNAKRKEVDDRVKHGI